MRTLTALQQLGTALWDKGSAGTVVMGPEPILRTRDDEDWMPQPSPMFATRPVESLACSAGSKKAHISKVCRRQYVGVSALTMTAANINLVRDLVYPSARRIERLQESRLGRPHIRTKPLQSLGLYKERDLDRTIIAPETHTIAALIETAARIRKSQRHHCLLHASDDTGPRRAQTSLTGLGQSAPEEKFRLDLPVHGDLHDSVDNPQALSASQRSALRSVFRLHNIVRAFRALAYIPRNSDPPAASTRSP